MVKVCLGSDEKFEVVMWVDEVEDRECDFLSGESSNYLPWLCICFLSEVWVQHNLWFFSFPSFYGSDYLPWFYVFFFRPSWAAIISHFFSDFL